jgi:hypothetical protein
MINFMLLGGGSNLHFCNNFDGRLFAVNLRGIEVVERDGGACHN